MLTSFDARHNRFLHVENKIVRAHLKRPPASLPAAVVDKGESWGASTTGGGAWSSGGCGIHPTGTRSLRSGFRIQGRRFKVWLDLPTFTDISPARSAPSGSFTRPDSVGPTGTKRSQGLGFSEPWILRPQWGQKIDLKGSSFRVSPHVVIVGLLTERGTAKQK